MLYYLATDKGEKFMEGLYARAQLMWHQVGSTDILT